MRTKDFIKSLSYSKIVFLLLFTAPAVASAFIIQEQLDDSDLNERIIPLLMLISYLFFIISMLNYFIYRKSGRISAVVPVIINFIAIGSFGIMLNMPAVFIIPFLFVAGVWEIFEKKFLVAAVYILLFLATITPFVFVWQTGLEMEKRSEGMKDQVQDQSEH